MPSSLNMIKLKLRLIWHLITFHVIFRRLLCESKETETGNHGRTNVICAKSSWQPEVKKKKIKKSQPGFEPGPSRFSEQRATTELRDLVLHFASKSPIYSLQGSSISAWLVTILSLLSQGTALNGSYQTWQRYSQGKRSTSQVSAWQSATLLPISYKWVEEPASPEKSSSDGATNNPPFPKMQPAQ